MANHNKHRARKRSYDPIADKYELTAAELANLEIGSAMNAATAAANAARVHKLIASGRCVADIVIMTGLSRATVYRAVRRLNGAASEARDPLLE
jgi:DNA invertase Pin-like site-specific DNA recombinase